MKFIVSSSELLSHLQSISKAISGKATIPILDHFLFDLVDGDLTITASDLESTLITKMSPENVDGEGSIALEAKRLLDILKEFPEQPLTFDIDLESLATSILSENGKFSIIGAPADEFPKQIELDEEKTFSLTINSGILEKGINKTIFATANDELRPVMNGIYFELSADNITFVASDSHKLIKYQRNDAKATDTASFILPKKPASLLKNILTGEEDVIVKFDNKNAVFELPDYKLISRLTEGNYPNYQSVIPTENPNKLIINRSSLYNTIKRVSVFSNQASNLVKLELTANQVTISAQDIDFSISAYERLNCRYEGEEMAIGFKSTFLNEILSNIASDEIILEMSDPSRAGLIFPFEKESDETEELMLLMPMMIN